MTSRRAIVTDIERDLKGFQEPQARGASNTPGAQDSVGGRGTTQAASTQLETHGVQLRHCDQILTLAAGRLRCSPCAYSEAIIAVIMTAMPLPSPPLCRFPGGGQRKALTFRAAEAGGVRHPGIVPGTSACPRKTGDSRGDI